MASCEKKAIEDFSQSNLQNGPNGLDKTVSLISNPLPVASYLVNNEDRDDEKINQQLHDIALTVRDLFADNKYNKLVVSEAMKHDNNSVSIATFISAASSLRSSNEDATFTNLGRLTGNVDLTHKSQNPEKSGEIEDYTPAIFVVNAEIADYTKTPIISAGTYVNSSLPGMAEFDEYIVAWVSNGQGEFDEFLINEETSMTTTHPIFIIDQDPDPKLNLSSL